MTQIGDTYHVFEVAIHNAPALCIPFISGLTTPANTAPDNTVTNGIVIPIHLTALNGPNTEQIQTIKALPILSPKNLSYGGQMASFAPRILPRLQLEGYIDTPCTQIGENYIPRVKDSNSNPYLYTEVLIMMIEGRANTSTSGWERLDPIWFRDPYGRVYVDPVIVDFQASYLSGVPERSQFSMTLKV